MRIRLTRSARILGKAQHQALLLGYEPELDVFVAWPPRHRPKRTARWVPVSTLRSARGFGLVEKIRNGEKVVAFRPDCIREYLERQEEVAAAASRPSRFEPGWARAPMGMGSGPLVARARNRRHFRRKRHERREEGLAKARSSAPPDRTVETGLAPADRPGEPLDRAVPLEPDAPYLYWFAVGAGTEASIEIEPTPLPDDLPDCARLTVQLFGFEEEIELSGADRGVIEVSAGAGVRVLEPAALPPMEPELEGERLFFLIRTPDEPGVYRFRCNLYHGSTLLQSRLVAARVGGEWDSERPALSSQLDYSISASLALADVARVPEHDLSLMVNGGGPGFAATHQFRFYADGDEPLVADASLDSAAIEAAITAARGALRHASWGSEEEWKKGWSYLYEATPADMARFERDLIELAIKGHRLYIGVTGGMKDGYETRRKLRQAMAAGSGRIQIAAAAAALYVPAGLFYDHPLEVSASAKGRGAMSLCATFLETLQQGRPLDQSPCFAGECPQRDDETVVCPGGFWGYRHEVGWPLETEHSDGKVPVDGRPQLAIGVCTAPDLKRRVAHSVRVLAMGEGTIAETREQFRDLVKEQAPHLVYLYCHGGITADGITPYVIVGPADSNGIDTAWLVNQRIRWAKPRPLVFINGCHTTAVEPRQLMDLVGGFVREANAIGALGTEITVFEPLACVFAEDMLDRFLGRASTVGAAVRQARLSLLSNHNPLGLAYVPFVAADTQLVPVPALEPGAG